jgi:hypothetical protein
MIGKGYADLRDLPLGGTWIGIIRKLACHSFGSRSRIPASDMIQQGRTGGDQFETPAAADLQTNWWVTDTDGRKDRGVRPDRAHGAHEHEAKEHDLPRFRKGRA